MKLSLIDRRGGVRWSDEAEDEIWLSWRGSYEAEDALVVEADADEAWLWLQLDSCLEPSLALLRGGRFVFEIPLDERQVAYGKDWAFEGKRHWAHARIADRREVAGWRNLALNAHDTESDEGRGPALFPHAETNVVCGNPQFWARNAIDGVFDSSRHGSWPHTSWGIAGRADAELTIEFGVPVIADELRLYLRADFPHDSWWKEATVLLSDGTHMTITLEKTGRCQRFDLGGARIEWLRLCELKKGCAEGFPALSQMEVWGAVAEAAKGGTLDAQ
ncbi:MAG: hypothetical protein ACI361_00190 [Atopobiaceae bacterium]